MVEQIEKMEEIPYLCWFIDDTEKWVANIKKDTLIKIRPDNSKIYKHITQKGAEKYYIYNNGQFNLFTKKYPSSSS